MAVVIIIFIKIAYSGDDISVRMLIRLIIDCLLYVSINWAGQWLTFVRDEATCVLCPA